MKRFNLQETFKYNGYLESLTDSCAKRVCDKFYVSKRLATV